MNKNTREEQSTVLPLINDIAKHPPQDAELVPDLHDLVFIQPVANSNTIYGDKYQIHVD